MPTRKRALMPHPAVSRSQTPAPSLERDPSLPVRGLLVNRQNNLPLPGLLVEVYDAEGPPEQPAARRGAVRVARQKHPALGRAVTDSDGRFEVGFETSADAQGVRLRLGQAGLGALRLVVRDPSGARTYGTFPVSVSETIHPLRLVLSVPAKAVTAGLWRSLGRRMEATRTVRIREVARRVASTADTSLGSWDFETRQALLVQMEAEFLDPTGELRAKGLPPPTFYAFQAPGALDEAAKKLSSQRRSTGVELAFQIMSAKVTGFDSLFAVDWVLDPVQFKKGNPGAGLDQFKDLYISNLSTAGDSDALAKLLDSWLHEASQRSRYRDYLRTIYTGPTDSPAYAARLKKLETRFGQDFETLDDTDQPANAVLIPILMGLLQAPVGQGYGFGVAASKIQAQGSSAAREYLDYLIGLTKLTAEELRARYRLSFTRDDSAVSSRVRENIAALQGFLADGFQSPDDPFPLYPAKLRGLAPFFLQYEEWLSLNGPFYGENHFQIKETFRIQIDPKTRAVWEADPDQYKGSAQEWVINFVLAENQMNEGYKRYSEGQFQLARDAYDLAETVAMAAFKKALQEDLGKVTLSDTIVLNHLAKKLLDLKTLPMKGIKDVAAYTDAWVAPAFGGEDALTKSSEFDDWLGYSRERLEAGLLHFLTLGLPVLRGDLALAAGDYLGAVQAYEKATRFLMARADLLDGEGYDPEWNTYQFPTLVPTLETGIYLPRLYHKDGPLPYTTPRFQASDTVNFVDGWGTPDWFAVTTARLAKDYLHPMERAFLRLRHGQALLEWADALYRADTPSDAARARELYKAVLWLHGEDPAMIPYWPTDGFIFFFTVTNQDENPALASQKARARLGFSQIQDGLNYYGLGDAFIPSLRYRPLKDAADRYAATAKSAQQDFVLYMEKIEDAIRDGMIQSSMLKKAELQGEIAAEQVQLANFAAQLAKNQIDQVKQAIQAKKDEIADSEEFFNQFTGFIGGMKDAISNLPEKLPTFAAQGLQGAAGVNWTGDATLTGASAGAGAMAGYGLFVYAGYTSLSSLADKSNDLQKQLSILQNQALPLAQAQWEARQREIKIAQLNGQIAQADASLARSLLRFQSARFLNTEFWAHLAGVMRRVMQRFLTLGARFAWQAERALAYEQNRPLDVIRFDYFPKKLQGVTGADLLQLDLGELEAARLEGARQTIPVRRTFSLAFDFPLEFAKLKAEGSCSFFTQEWPLRLAYPGTYGYRLRAVTVKVGGLSPLGPAQGMLTNWGMSLISRSDATASLSLRPREAFPLSEFQLERDMAVYSLPDEVLMLFEGSGIETLWTLDFPPAANPNGLASVADIQLTFDLQAQYSPELAVQDGAAAPKTARRYVFLSARAWDADALDDFRKNGSALFEFDPRKLPLPAREKNRTVTNALLFVAEREAQTATATIKTATPGGLVIVKLKQNAAISNAPPFAASPAFPASPLNALAGRSFDQVFSVQLQKSGTADFTSAADVVLGLEYSADLA